MGPALGHSGDCVEPCRRLHGDRAVCTYPKILAGGIYQALITTVAGLIIAIPLIVFQEHLRKETNRILAFLDLYLAEIKDWVARRDRRAEEVVRA